MQMPGRNGGEDYRYAFNGMEHDPEVSGDGNSYTTEFRAYDPRLGRWKSLDPLMAKFAHSSPYVGFANNPIVFIDPYGLEASTGGGLSDMLSSAAGASAAGADGTEVPGSYSSLTGNSNLLIFINDGIATDKTEFDKEAENWDYVVAGSFEEAQQILKLHYGDKTEFVDNLIIRSHGGPGAYNSSTETVVMPETDTDASATAFKYYRTLATNAAVVFSTACNLCMDNAEFGEHADFWVKNSKRKFLTNFASTSSRYARNTDGEPGFDVHYFAFNEKMVKETDAGAYYGGIKVFSWDKTAGSAIAIKTFYDIEVISIPLYGGGIELTKLDIQYKERVVTGCSVTGDVESIEFYKAKGVKFKTN
jgi:RHS repeat-associated protein